MLIFSMLAISLYSQEVYRTYELKKLKGPLFKVIQVKLSNKKAFNIMDSLTLFNNGEYFRKEYSNFHQLESFEEKGKWVITKDSLFLHVNKIRVFPEYNKEWKLYNRIDTFLIKKTKIIPLFNDSLYRSKKLKLI